MSPMNPIDDADKRPPFVKVANSIRAAILTSEFEPGDRLPSGQELADFFGVARMTVHQAIRTLRDEGFVTSRAGSGVFVRDRPEVSQDGEASVHELTGTAAFLHEMGYLKKLPRTGWFLTGVKYPETIAEHSFRTAIVGIVLASLEGADVGRTAAICLMHDSPETRTGDIPSLGRPYVSTAKPEAVSNHQTAAMPDEVAATVQQLVHEYEATESIESRLAHDADKIEMLLQAREYRAESQHNTAEWEQSATATLQTAAAKHLAEAITATDPEKWWSAFPKTYSELRKASRGKHDIRVRRPRVPEA